MTIPPRGGSALLLVGALALSVGDSEQLLPGERLGLDPLLRRNPAESR